MTFLDNRDWISAHRNKFRSALERSNQLGEASTKLLTTAQVREDNLREIVVSSLLARSLEHYASVIRNAESGWPAPTQVALRALIESVFTLRAVANDSEVLQRYLAEDDYQRLALLKKLERTTTLALRKHYDADLKAELEEKIARTSTSMASLRTDVLAEKAGLLEWYLVVYATLTGPAHSKIRDLQRYVQSSAPEPLSLSLAPSEDDTLGLLSTAGNALLFAVETFQAVFDLSIEENVEDLRRLFQKWGAVDGSGSMQNGA